MRLLLMKNRWRGIVDSGRLADNLDQLRKYEFRTAARHRLGDSPAGDCFQVLRQQREEVAVIDAGIPDVEHVHFGEGPHVRAVAARGGNRRVTAVAVAQTVGAGRKDQRRHEPLDIPLPRRGQRLVEVVDIENQPALRRSETAEIHQMSVAARLNMDARRRRAGQGPPP